jgi:hypothetical protein
MSKYLCNPLNIPGQGGVIDAASAAPVVIAQFQGGGFDILVGNESAPSFGHNASIKSMEYGTSDGHANTIEIVDVSGGVLSGLLDNIIKCAKKADIKEYHVRFKFGWVYTDCFSGAAQTLGLDFWVESAVADIETNYKDGKIYYRVEATDTVNTYFDMKEDDVFGEDGKYMKLEEAIRKLCDLPPKVNVKFCKKNPDGSIVCGKTKWKGFPEGGPKAKWPADSKNKLATITEWLEPYQTEENKGFHVTWDNSQRNSIIIWESWEKKKCESMICGGGFVNLGTFLVNAGKCSNVIEFQPNFKIKNAFASMASGGETAGAHDGGTELKETERPDCEKKQGKSTGTQQQITTPEHAIIAHGNVNATKEQSSAQNANARANQFWGILEPIDAELTIIGNPSYAEYISIPQIPRVCSVVAINPFHIAMGGPCGDWLALPGCNQVLSNKNWRVQGINHSIQAGSYSTTLKLALDVPEVNTGGSELGGAGSNGYQPANLC